MRKKMKPMLLLLLAVLTAASMLPAGWEGKAIAASSTITTVAGDGDGQYGGDGGPATSASLFNPRGIAKDAAGNLYIADSLDNRIRKVVQATGNISTIVSPIKNISEPAAVAVDGSGTVYIADTGKHVIRKLVGSTLTIIAGTSGAAGFGGDSGAATAAALNFPSGLALDATGNLYIADSSNNRIRKIDGSGVITTIAGDGMAGDTGDGGDPLLARLYGPNDVKVDSAGNIYIADTYSNRIRKISQATGKIDTIAGTGSAGFSGDGGAATSAQLKSPGGVAVDAAGNVYIADTLNHRIRKIDTNGNITTVAGTGTAGYSGDGGSAAAAKLNGPSGIIVDGSGALYVADSENNAIRKIVFSANSAVTYDANGATSGSVPSDSGSYAPGATVTVLGNTGNLAKTGSTFAGWNTKADGSGTDYAAAATFSMGSADVTLYAKWTASSGGGGSLSGVSLDATKYTLAVGGKYTTVLRSNASDNSSAAIAAGSVTFASSNPAVATVAASGEVTGVAKGTVTISTYYTSGGTTYTRYATVTVDPKAPSFVDANDKKAGAIYVSVVDPNGAAVKDAAVKVSQGSKVYPLAKTDSNGRALLYVPAGTYSVVVYAPNGMTLQNYTVKSLKVLAGQRSEPFAKQQFTAGMVALTVNTIAGADKTIAGTAPTGSTVTARVGSATVGTAKADKTGNFTIKLKTPQPGKTVVVTAVDADENEKSVSKDVPKAAAVTLTAAMKNNDVNHDIVITFKDTVGLLPTTVTAVTYNGNTLAKDTAYTIASGKLTLKKGTIGTPGSYPIVVKSSAYEDSQVTQEIKAGTTK